MANVSFFVVYIAVCGFVGDGRVFSFFVRFFVFNFGYFRDLSDVGFFLVVEVFEEEILCLGEDIN